MRRFKGKENINTMLNIDNIFGEHEGHAMPIFLTMGCAAIPLFIWLFFLGHYGVPIWPVIVFDVLFTGRMGLILIGKEKEKLRFYLQQRSDEYKSADELIHINYIHDDGLIEYDNGMVAYIVTGYLQGYLTDDKMSVDVESFMNELDHWGWDIYFHNTVDELLCEDTLPNLSKYTDNEIIKDRIEFYTYQDEWSRTHTGLYRISFLVYTSKYNWKKLKSHMEELIGSDQARIFNEIEIANKHLAYDILNRDICGYADINKMLVNKYDNTQFYASKVLWYDDEVPQQYVPPKETSGLEERRQ